MTTEREYIAQAEYWLAEATHLNRTPEGALAYATIASVCIELSKIAHRHADMISKFEATRQLGPG